MGQSAGASSAHLHMMSSPKWSRELFQKVILLSGNGNGPYAYVIKDPLEQAKQFAKAIGIKNFKDMQTSTLANELRHSSPEDLINACDKLKIWSIDPLTISRPVVEDCKSYEGFLCDNPADSWRTGNFARVPMLTGYMDQDGGVRALTILENKTQFDGLNKRFDELMPKLMEIEDTSAETNAKHLNKIKKRYFDGNSEIKNDTSIIRLFSERSFIAPLYNTLQQLVQQDRKTPVFLYKFSFKGPLSYSFFFTGNSKNYGPVHCDELIYLLKSPMLFPVDFEKRSVEAVFRTKFVKFFTDFVSNGKPSRINGRSIQKCEASNYKSPNASLKCNYIEFGENLSIKFNGEIDSSIAEFWNDIDQTMVKKKKQQPTATVIEVSQIISSNPSHHQKFLES